MAFDYYRFEHFAEKIEKLISQTKIDDNPIIMLCHLK